MKKLLSFLLMSTLLVGCSAFHQKEEVASSSLIDFLYPNDTGYQTHTPATPHLTLPLNIGIAFVPNTNYGKLNLSAKQKHDILTQVKSEFSDLGYVNRIEIISDHYLKSGGGFDNLDQLSRIYNVDVMALVSYDQIARNTQNHASLLYWTIAGLYLIPGDQNNTQTFVDTAVFDIKSRQLLLRAPGVSEVDSLSTAVGVEDNFYEDSSQGFDLAVSDMVVNLSSELETFKIRVKEENIAKVSYSNNYSGGSLSWWLVALLTTTWLLRRRV